MRKILLIYFSLSFLFSCSTFIPVNYDSVIYNIATEDLGISQYFNSPDIIYLCKLKKYLPEEIVADKTDIEKVLSVTNYVTGLWKHNGWNKPKKNDPISILEEVELGKDFRCVEYAIVISGFLNSLGIPTRTVGLKTKDVETRAIGAGHMVAESYIKNEGKWIMVDPQWNVVPMKDGEPLSIIEFQQALFHKETGINVSEKYQMWIKAYLFYLDTSIDLRYENRKDIRKLMLVPLDAKNPTVFQIKYPLENMIYTHSLVDFYREPLIPNG